MASRRAVGVQAVAMASAATARPATRRALPVELAAAGYFGLQAGLGVLLWVGVVTSDAVRSWLELVPAHREVTNAFFPADVVVIVSSALAAWALWRGRPWAMVPVMFTLGGIVYPTAYLVGWRAAGEGTAAVALGIMLTASALSCGAALLAWRARPRA